MSITLQNQIVFERNATGLHALAFHFTAPPPNHQLDRSIEGVLSAAGLEVGAPIDRVLGDTLEIILLVSHVERAMKSLLALFSRMGISPRIGELNRTGEWRELHPQPGVEFALLPEPVTREDRMALLDVEIKRLTALREKAEATGRTDLLAHVAEHMEAVKAAQFRLKTESCAGQS